MNFRLVIDYLVYLALRLMICGMQALPISVCARISESLAYLMNDVLNLRGKLVDENLRHAFPDWSPGQRKDTARKMWYHLLLMVCEIAHAPRKMHDSNWRDHVDCHRVDEQVKYLFGDRPVVILLGHFGNFEMMGYVAGILGFPTHTVARPLDNKFLHNYILKFRSATGQYILPKDGSAPVIEQILDEGGTMALLCDQSAGRKGCWVEFFNRPASCHKAISLFSLTSDAPLVVCYFRRKGAPMQFEMGVAGIFDPAKQEGRSSVQELSLWYNKLLEEMVRRDPDQYWWVHNRWKDDRLLHKEKKKKLKQEELAARKMAA
ncbi:MAG: lysophospholipid acyltransferase family protein [Pirellulales bacterium]